MSFLNKISNAAIKAATHHMANYQQASRELKISENTINSLINKSIKKSSYFTSITTAFNSDSALITVTKKNNDFFSLTLKPVSLFITHKEIIFEGLIEESKESSERLMEAFPKIQITNDKLTFKNNITNPAFISTLKEQGINLEGQLIPLSIDYNNLVLSLENVVSSDFELDVLGLIKTFRL